MPPQVMRDPVVLTATGQVYDYTSLMEWLKTGNRRCPKTNLEILDVQVRRQLLARVAPPLVFLVGCCDC
jgi:hypothetical protein